MVITIVFVPDMQQNLCTTPRQLCNIFEPGVDCGPDGICL